MKKTCAAVLHRDEHTDALYRPLLAYVEDVVEFPVVDMLEDFGVDMRRNGRETAVIAAIAAGRISYINGVFSGGFDAATSRELRSFGARFYRRDNTFRLEAHEVPLGVRHAASVAKGDSETLHAKLAALLLIVAANIGESETGINTTASAAIIQRDMTAQLAKTLPTGFTVPQVSLSIESLAALKTQVDDAIKKNAAESARELAEAIQRNAATGASVEKLREIIAVHFDRMRKRAKSVAEHQTALFIAAERERLYTSIGVESYIWQTRLDERVRADHRVLEGRRFTWDAPPVTNRATGEHNHPGEDHGCRCAPCPVIYIPEE